MTMTATTTIWRDYCDAVKAAREKHPDWRAGQTLYNVLFFESCGAFDSAFADEIRGGSLDPFYVDARIPSFIAALRNHWS
jgi:hypothetical protein